MAELVVCLAMAKNTKPFVQLACVCERAVEEKDGVLTLFRVIDTVFTGLKAEAPANALPTVEFDCVVSVKSGDLVGTYNELMLRATAPGGKSENMVPQPIRTVFTGGSNGINVKVHLVLQVKTFGIMWFDVLWGTEVLTRIPLDIKQLSQQAPGEH